MAASQFPVSRFQNIIMPSADPLITSLPSTFPKKKKQKRKTYKDRFRYFTGNLVLQNVGTQTNRNFVTRVPAFSSAFASWPVFTLHSHWPVAIISFVLIGCCPFYDTHSKTAVRSNEFITSKSYRVERSYRCGQNSVSMSFQCMKTLSCLYVPQF